MQSIKQLWVIIDGLTFTSTNLSKLIRQTSDVTLAQTVINLPHLRYLILWDAGKGALYVHVTPAQFHTYIKHAIAVGQNG